MMTSFAGVGIEERKSTSPPCRTKRDKDGAAAELVVWKGRGSAPIRYPHRLGRATLVRMPGRGTGHRRRQGSFDSAERFAFANHSATLRMTSMELPAISRARGG